jgi:deoxyadenosine/deoxycytidine kinase
MEERGRFPRYIAVEGPIGVGKTSLVTLLAQRLQAREVYERVEENPFLERFYQNPKKYAFQTQIFFLFSRFQQQLEIIQQDLFKWITISDYLFEKDKIFAHLTLDRDEIELYEKIYALLSPRVPKPSLVIYLQANAETLISRIKGRNRPSDKGITFDYIEEIKRAYDQFFFNYNACPLLTINTVEWNFLNDPQELSRLIKEIRNVKAGMQYYIPRTGR